MRLLSRGPEVKKIPIRRPSRTRIRTRIRTRTRTRIQQNKQILIVIDKKKNKKIN
jgi:hypothetical protein